MDKKQNSRSNLTSTCVKGQISESRKSQDVSGGKQWPRNGRHRESTSNYFFNSTPNNSSSINNKSDQNYNKPSAARGPNSDKRYRGRAGNGYQRNFGPPTPITPSSSTGLEQDDAFEAEINSVQRPGSKKQSLNHLLNFNYSPRDRQDPGTFVRTGNYRNGCIRKIKYNKEQFLQATCQFVVRADIDWKPYSISPDTLVDWQFIEQIHVQTDEEPQCPICLYHPVAGKMTRCGHIYCWPCVLHYLALSDKTWRKCPICYEAIHLDDLKSAISKPHPNINVGDYVDLQLMCREKGSLNVFKTTNKSRANCFPHLFGDADEIMHSKLVLADPGEIMTIIDREEIELKSQLADDGVDCPESVFIQQSLNLLDERRCNTIKQLKKFETGKPANKTVEHTVDNITEALKFVDLAMEVTETPNSNSDVSNINFIIDEETNLTLHDIDIMPAVHDSSHFYFYQATDGQHLYLHSVNVRMLQAMYGSLDKSPNLIRGKVLQKETCSMTEVLRKRLKYLQHLPVTSQFEVVEIGLDESIISVEVLAKFKDELTHRQKMRQRRAKEEWKRERLIDEVNERQIGKILERSANIDVTSDRQFPMCLSYESPPFNGRDDPPLTALSPSSLSEFLSTSGGPSTSSSGPSFARMLTTTAKPELWPTLGPTKAPILIESTTKLIQVTGGNRSGTIISSGRQLRQSENEEVADVDDEDLLAKAPEFKSSFGSAIAEALQNKSMLEGYAQHSGGNGGRKKKNKKMILFSTGGRPFNGN